MKKTLVVFLALLCMGTLAYADSFQVLNSRAQQNPTDIIDWGQLGPPLTAVNSPANVQSFNGLNATVSIPGSFFFTMQQGTTWNGNFDFGENLIWTGNDFGGGPGPFTVNFASGVSSVGFLISANYYGNFTATLQAYNGNNLLYTLIENGVSNGNGDGSALFMGLADLSGANINKIVISETDPNSPTPQNFAIDAITLTTGTQQVVPEPGSIALLGTGLLGLAGMLRRKLGR